MFQLKTHYPPRWCARQSVDPAWYSAVCVLHPHRGHRRYALRDGQIVVPNFHRLLLPGFPAAEIADHVFVDWNLPQFSPSSVVACFGAGRAPMQFCEFSYPSLDGVCIERLETPPTTPFPDCEAGRASIGTVWVLVGVFIWLEHLGLPHSFTRLRTKL